MAIYSPPRNPRASHWTTAPKTHCGRATAHLNSNTYSCYGLSWDLKAAHQSQVTNLLHSCRVVIVVSKALILVYEVRVGYCSTYVAVIPLIFFFGAAAIKTCNCNSQLIWRFQDHVVHMRTTINHAWLKFVLDSNLIPWQIRGGPWSTIFDRCMSI